MNAVNLRSMVISRMRSWNPSTWQAPRAGRECTTTGIPITPASAASPLLNPITRPEDVRTESRSRDRKRGARDRCAAGRAECVVALETAERLFEIWMTFPAWNKTTCRPAFGLGSFSSDPGARKVPPMR